MNINIGEKFRGRLALQIKRDGKTEWGTLSTTHSSEHKTIQQAIDHLVKVSQGWIHNGGAEYATASYQIVERDRF